MTKGKVIGFVKEHKKDIIHIAVTGAIGVVAFKAGKRQVSKNKSEFDKCIDDMINDILNNAYELYSDKTMGFVGLTGKKLSIKPGELGKLNEVLFKINDQDIPETFTNFILFGPMKEQMKILYYKDKGTNYWCSYFLYRKEYTLKFVGWDLYLLKFVCYAGAVFSKDMRWFIVVALLTIAHELRHIWKKGEQQ